MEEEQFDYLRGKTNEELQELAAKNIGNPRGEFAKSELEIRFFKKRQEQINSETELAQKNFNLAKKLFCLSKWNAVLVFVTVLMVAIQTYLMLKKI